MPQRILKESTIIMPDLWLYSRGGSGQGVRLVFTALAHWEKKRTNRPHGTHYCFFMQNIICKESFNLRKSWIWSEINSVLCQESPGLRRLTHPQLREQLIAGTDGRHSLQTVDCLRFSPMQFSKLYLFAFNSKYSLEITLGKGCVMRDWPGSKKLSNLARLVL